MRGNLHSVSARYDDGDVIGAAKQKQMKYKSDAENFRASKLKAMRENLVYSLSSNTVFCFHNIQKLFLKLVFRNFHNVNPPISICGESSSSFRTRQRFQSAPSGEGGRKVLIGLV